MDGIFFKNFHHYFLKGGFYMILHQAFRVIAHKKAAPGSLASMRTSVSSKKGSVSKVFIGCLIVAGLLATTGTAKTKSTDLTITPATITIYRKGVFPIVDTVSQVKSITFGGAAGVLANKSRRITHSLQVQPVQGAMRFSLNGTPGTAGEFKLYTISGRLVFSQPIQLDGNGSYKSTVPAITSGLYIARFVNGAFKFSNKVLSYN
jgi:hypothetical protein